MFEATRAVAVPVASVAIVSTTKQNGLLDTVVVPAQQEGFESVFLGQNCWCSIRIAGGMLDKITAEHFPQKVIACAYIQTYFLVLPANSRQFHYSRQFNGLEWDAFDVAQKANTPDVLRGLVVHDDVVRLILLNGVNYDSTWRYTTGISPKGVAAGKSTNDDNADWQPAYALFPGRIAYVWFSRDRDGVETVGRRLEGGPSETSRRPPRRARRQRPRAPGGRRPHQVQSIQDRATRTRRSLSPRTRPPSSRGASRRRSSH